jgi:hypothetical protein
MAMQWDDTMTNILRTTGRGLRAVAVPVICALALTSCDVDEFLNTQPLGELTGSTFYQSEEDFEAATLGPYSTMLNLTYDQFGLGWWNGFLIPDDDVQFRDPNNANDFFNWNAGNGDFAWVWEQSYKGIMRANVVLQQLPDASDFSDEANKARYEAEAKYMRAYWYFILARNWGNVPILTEVVSSVDAAQVGNSATGEVWDLIESDLDFAIQNLPDSYSQDQTGRATRFSALALAGKVELYRAQWGAAAGVSDAQAKYQEAIGHLEQVVNSGQFSLTADYGDNFQTATENNSESLFEVQATVGDNINAWGPTDLGYGAAGHAWPIYVSPSCYYDATGGHCAPNAWGHGYGQVDITQSLIDEFEPGDPRFYYTMYSSGETYAWTTYNFDWDDSHTSGLEQWSRTAHTPAKYNRPFDPNRYPNNLSTNNLRIIRYADVLLMLAEAYVHTNQPAMALPLVNQVRARARGTYAILCGGSPPPTLDCGLTNVVPDLASVTFADIEHERRVELATEVHRYDDLVRWHRAGLIDIPTFVNWGYSDNDNWSTTHLLKPIPQGELDLNANLTQNPGY